MQRSIQQRRSTRSMATEINHRPVNAIKCLMEYCDIGYGCCNSFRSALLVLLVCLFIVLSCHMFCEQIKWYEWYDTISERGCVVGMSSNKFVYFTVIVNNYFCYLPSCLRSPDSSFHYIRSYLFFISYGIPYITSSHLPSYHQRHQQFLPHDAIHSANDAVENVRQSFCLTLSGIVSKRLNTLSKIFFIAR